MRRPILLASLAAIVLAGCATGAALFNQPANQQPFNQGRVQGLSTNNSPVASVTQQVSVERIKATAAVLTGQAKMPDGRTIPERGTVEGRNLTRAYLTQVLESYGYKVEPHNYRNNGTNITARLMAETPSNEYILVGAHMDSVRNAGADDNNSGSSAVLETARVLKQVAGRKVNIIFAWFDEEEIGLIGSYALARELKKQKQIVTSVHTLDMVGWDGDRDNIIEVEQPDANLWEYYNQANQTHGLKLPLKRTSSGDTDHVAFREEGFVSVGLCEEWVGGDVTPHYHRRTDAFTTLNFEFLTSVTRLITAVTADLSRGVSGPIVTTRIPHDRFPGKQRHRHTSYEGLPLP